eukprot:gene2523-4553_t
MYFLAPPSACMRSWSRRELQLVRAEHGRVRPIIHMNESQVKLLNHERNFVAEEAFEFDEAFWSIPR